MSKFRGYLQLTRAHTAPLEMIPAIVGAVLVTGELVSAQVAIAGLFGLFYHLTGYGHNSYSDWRNGYDKDDEHKQHHPLNTGELAPHDAKEFIFISAAITAIIGVAMSLNSPDALAYLILAVIAGVYYNEMGKQTYLKFIPISFAHTSTFAVPYLALGGHPSDRLFLLGAGFVFLWVVYQISVSGEVKDLDTDEENLIRRLGLVERYMFDEERNMVKRLVVPPEARTYSYTLRLVIGFWALIGAILYIGREYTLILIPFFVLLSVYLNAVMMGRDLNNRDARIRNMALIEFCSMAIFLSMYAPLLSLTVAGGLMGLAFLWVRAGNWYLWGTSIAPKV